MTRARDPRKTDSVIDVGNRIEQLFLTTIPMAFPLFFESALSEIQKVPGDQLVLVRSSKFSLLIVFSQPGFSYKNRSIFTFDCHLYVVHLNLRESPFQQVRSGFRIRIA